MNLTIPNQEVFLPILKEKGLRLFIKREDTIHPYISGNKYRKLKYNIKEAKQLNKTVLLTFGGAYSNHIMAVAAVGEKYGFKTIGVIRGEELSDKIADNPTLALASDFGMKFHFVSRASYREKEESHFIEMLKGEFGDFYLVPEGGTNVLAVQGCEEILTEKDADFDSVACAVGTGGTIAGIINSSTIKQQIIGFPALKGDFLEQDICTFVKKTNWTLNLEYHFGGYAKINEGLVTFINDFKNETTIPLDPIYTGKMMFGIMDLIKRDKFKKGTKILAIHTGGLQGITGMNAVLKKKGIPIIEH